MPEIKVYTTPTCPYCRAAKDLLRRKGVEFLEINIAGDSARRAEMIELANGRTTVPQIFVDSRHVGGCDDLHALEAEGNLDQLLAT